MSLPSSDQNSSSKPKSVLTHNRKVDAVPPEVVTAEAAPVVQIKADKPQQSSQALSEKMAKISSIREKITHQSSQDHEAESKIASTLPNAMARAHRKHQEEHIREMLSESEDYSQLKVHLYDSEEEADLEVEDPTPGTLKALTWFCFSFGRYAKGVLLNQPVQITFLFYLLIAFGSIHLTLSWLSPLPGPGPIYNQDFATQVLAGGMLLGMVFYLGMSLILFGTVTKFLGSFGRTFSLKIMINAFLPLGLCQIIAMGLGTLLLGEAYWRGALPIGHHIFTLWILPFMWIWGFFRIGQVIGGMFHFPVLNRIIFKTILCSFAVIPLLFLHSERLQSFMGRNNDQAWLALKNEAIASGSALPISTYDDMESQLGFYQTNRKRDLYLFRMQANYRLDNLSAARADAWRLDRMAKPHSADDELAKGLNLMLQNRIDFAIPRLQNALAIDPKCYPAHQWMALALATEDIKAAEHHARILMEADPNIFHLQLLVRLLYAQEAYQDIWDAMLMVEAPPEEWAPITLYQGAIASEAIGNVRRSQMLLNLAKAHESESDSE